MLARITKGFEIHLPKGAVLNMYLLTADEFKQINLLKRMTVYELHSELFFSQCEQMRWVSRCGLKMQCIVYGIRLFRVQIK